MHYSYNWLKELSGTKKSPEQVAKLLLTHVFEVESIEKFSHQLDGVIVGKVMKLEKHPNADKLRIAQVATGKNDMHQIVCGAPNVAIGQKVVVALQGTVLPNGVEIKKVIIRGIESQSMICSARELALGDAQNGILVLPPDAPIGGSFVKYAKLDDSVLEVKILPDRGSDALAYQGLAREIAALEGSNPNFLEKKEKIIEAPKINQAPKVHIEYKEGCQRYMGMSFTNVIVDESPLWLKVKLIVSGLRPINNIVDITNYLMLLSGQPLHAFDADKLEGAIAIRRAKKNESITLLTGEVKQLTREDIVIADEKKALALAGVMGGLGASVTSDTKNIFLEIASFDGATIRRTVMRHGLATDSSYRFERNLDQNLPGIVDQRAIDLIVELAQGKLTGIRDVYPKVSKPWKVKLLLDRVENVLGVKLRTSEIARNLALLGLQVISGKNKITVVIPTRRPDLRDEWDLIEEIGRMHGYEKIPPLAPCLPLVPARKNSAKIFERRVKEYLSHGGFDEMMTYSFYSEKEVRGAILPFDHHLELTKPLSPDQKYLRMTQIPVLLTKVRENLRHFYTFNCFEWGSDFVKNSVTALPEEEKSLTLVSVTAKKSKHGEAFFSIKGKVSAFFASLQIDSGKIKWERPEQCSEVPMTSLLHPSRSVCLVFDGKITGFVGEINPRVLKSFGLEAHIAVAWFLTDTLRILQKKATVFQPLQKYPYALRDISLTFPKHVTVAQAETVLREAGAPLIRKVELFDIYERAKEKSLAFHLSFGAIDRTLSSQEMDECFARIVAQAKQLLKAYLRD